MFPTKNRETAITPWVKTGSSSFAPKSLNICWKPGMTKTSKTVRTAKKTQMTIDG